jgi:hypothetical protein
MQQNKITKDFSELKIIISDSEKMTSSLTDVMKVFNLKKYFSLFNQLKSKGIKVSNLLNILVLLPFYNVASIYSLYTSGIKTPDFIGQKDAYYDIKNNENINWRQLLISLSKRFRYLVNKSTNLISNGTTAIIFDDSLLEKTGKKIEKVGFVNDHVSGRFILGFKLLVCGFWDGASIIPLDFSLHREKGSKQGKLQKEYKKAQNNLLTTEKLLEKAQSTLKIKEEQLIKAQYSIDNKPGKSNQTKYDKSKLSFDKAKNNLDILQKELSVNKNISIEAKQKIKRYYAKDKLFGLTTKERQAQHKKEVAKRSCGNIRRRETDIDKISSMLKMLKRVVKSGFVADYVLTDSWFFCFDLLKELRDLKNGSIKLISMVRINNQLFTDISGRKMPVTKIPQIYQKHTQHSRKLKSQYIKVACFYQGIRVNLFYIKMGKSTKWHLLLTTDLNLNFVKLMETYQIRWSIEVFFKESKQYLKIGDCKSSTFDAHIADITVSMIQYIMLSYFKRVNYMQSIGNIFKYVSKELVEMDLVSRLLEIFWELIELFCNNAGIDFILFQEEVLSNDIFFTKMVSLLPESRLNKVA